MSLKVHVQTHALAFARCLCIRVRKCVLHRIVGRRRRGRRSWGVEYTVKKEQTKKKKGEKERRRKQR